MGFRVLAGFGRVVAFQRVDPYGRKYAYTPLADCGYAPLQEQIFSPQSLPVCGIGFQLIIDGCYLHRKAMHPFLYLHFSLHFYVEKDSHDVLTDEVRRQTTLLARGVRLNLLPAMPSNR